MKQESDLLMLTTESYQIIVYQTIVLLTEESHCILGSIALLEELNSQYSQLSYLSIIELVIKTIDDSDR